MIYGLYHSAAGMMTREYEQNVIANNLANAETVGFKQEVAVLAEREPESVSGGRQGPSAVGLEALSGGLWLGQTYTDWSQGTLVETGNEMDVALDGPGFLVTEADGRVLYTRDGRLMVDDTGQVRSATDGAPMLGPSGAPVQVNPFGGKPSCDEDGRVVQDGVIVGQLAVVDFADRDALRHAGSGRFDAGETATIPSVARVLSGKVEASSVDPVQELVGMIETARAYEINARMLSLQDQSASRLINLLAR
ncbi:MAG: flagellar hook-basal body protein [Phycisphaerae bacterium]|jgi:flagellar basal-body rod protein FlgG